MHNMPDRFRAKLIRRAIAETKKPGGKFLDIGTGIHSEYLEIPARKNPNWEFIGVDRIFKKERQVCRNLKLMPGRVGSLPFESSTFDACSQFGVLQMVPADILLLEINRFLVHNGIFLSLFGNLGNEFGILAKKHTALIPDLEEVLRLFKEKEKEEALNFYEKNIARKIALSVHDLFKKFGFEIIREETGLFKNRNAVFCRKARDVNKSPLSGIVVSIGLPYLNSVAILKTLKVFRQAQP